MMAVDEDKFGIKKKQEELLAETRKLPPGPQALEKLADLRGNIDWQIDGYRNTLSILSDTTYQDRKHFLLKTASYSCCYISNSCPMHLRRFFIYFCFIRFIYIIFCN
jgi:hypothetical protein